MAIDKATLNKLLEFLELMILELKEKKITLEQLEDNHDELYSIEHRIQLAIESAINIGEHLVSGLNLGLYDDAKGVFLILGKKRVIDNQLADNLKNAAGMRNILVHNYLEIDLQLIQKAATTDLKDLEEFTKQINTFLQKQQS